MDLTSIPRAADPAMWVTSLICAVSCGALVAAERRHSESGRRLAKVVASGAFVATALIAVRSTDTAGNAFLGFQLWAVIGLELGLIGDIALLSERHFAAGLAAFLAGHAAYTIAASYLLSPALWLQFADLFAAVPILAGLAVVISLWRRLGKYAVPVAVYAGAISVMVVATIAAARAGVAAPCLGIGACLLFVSDLAVARNKFVAPKFANKAWGLPTYYAAQLLIAWSLGDSG